jgi:hypothetical protein
MEFKNMTIDEINTNLNKIAKSISSDVLKVVVDQPWESKAKTGMNCVVKVVLDSGAVGRVAMFKHHEDKDHTNPIWSKLPIMKKGEDEEKKFMGYVNFGQDFLGSSYFKAVALVDGIADLAICLL